MALKSADSSREKTSGDSPFDLAGAATTGGSRRGSEVLVGLLLVVLCSLGAVWFYITSTAATPYLFLAQDVQQGERISRDDLIIYELNTEANLQAVPSTELATALDRIALTDLSAGTLLSPDQIADQEQIQPGSGVVGLDLEPGEYPTRSLRPGDLVRVVSIDGTGSGGEAFQVLIDGVEVVEVNAESGQRLFVSLVMPAEIANQVVTAEALGQVRLIQVPGG